VPSRVNLSEGAIYVPKLHWAKPTMGLLGVGWASAHLNNSSDQETHSENDRLSCQSLKARKVTTVTSLFGITFTCI
jgi:hypothetical protein